MLFLYVISTEGLNLKLSVNSLWCEVDTHSKLEAGRLIECITHASHLITFLHFVNLWPRPLTFWPNINCWVRTRDGLCQLWWFYFQPFWFYHADKQTESQMLSKRLLPQLSSAWVITKKNIKMRLIIGCKLALWKSLSNPKVVLRTQQQQLLMQLSLDTCLCLLTIIGHYWTVCIITVQYCLNCKLRWFCLG